MRNLLALGALLVLLFAGLGGVRGWYLLTGQPAATGKVAFRVEVDVLKVGADCLRAGRWLFEKLSDADEEKKAETKDRP